MMQYATLKYVVKLEGMSATNGDWNCVLTN